MNERILSDTVSVSPQIEVDDFPAIAAQGFDTVISNRPDHEAPGQPTAAELQQAAEAAGLDFHHLPVAGGQFTMDVIEGFRVATSSGKTLAFCASGTRSTCVWAMANSAEFGADAVIETAANAGYDISGLRPALR